MDGIRQMDLSVEVAKKNREGYGNTQLSGSTDMALCHFKCTHMHYEQFLVIPHLVRPNDRVDASGQLHVVEW